MRRCPGRSYLFGVLAFAAGSAFGQDAAQWVGRMNGAVETLNYRGVYAHMQGGTAENFLIVHINRDGRVGERIMSLDGAGREIIRDGDEVRCIFPDSEVVVLEDSGSERPLIVLPDYSETIAENYEFSLLHTARVADRRTQVVSIVPRDDLRYGYRLWLDIDTALPLKSQLIDEKGATVEQVLFSSIEIDDSIAEDELRPTINTEGFARIRPPSVASQARGRMSLVVRDLPRGFRFSTATKGPMAGSRLPVEHSVFSDGLATVSVFVEDPESSAEVRSGFSHLGTANAYSTSINGRQVTAVGEVPSRTLQRIADSLRDE